MKELAAANIQGLNRNVARLNFNFSLPNNPEKFKHRSEARPPLTKYSITLTLFLLNSATENR